MKNMQLLEGLHVFSYHSLFKCPLPIFHCKRWGVLIHTPFDCRGFMHGTHIHPHGVPYISVSSKCFAPMALYDSRSVLPPLTMQTSRPTRAKTIGTDRNLDQAGFSAQSHLVDLIAQARIKSEEGMPSHPDGGRCQQ